MRAAARRSPGWPAGLRHGAIGKLLSNGRVEGLSGANLPMLVRALAHRDEPLAEVVEKARSGAADGVVHMNVDRCCNA